MNRKWCLPFAVFSIIVFLFTTAFAQPDSALSRLHTVQGFAPNLPQATVTVNLSSTGFNPQEVTIEAGDSVTFHNQTGSLATLMEGVPTRIFLPVVVRPSNQAAGLAADPTALPSLPANKPNGPGTPIPAGGSVTKSFPTTGIYDFYHQEHSFHTVRVIVVGAKDFTLTPAPLTRSINATQQTTYTVTLASLNGFNHPLTLGVSGLPTGATPQWSTNPSTPPAAPMLTLTTSAATPAGDFPLTLRATDGTITHTTQVTLTILPWPDLAVTHVQPVPTFYTVGQSNSFTATLANLGPGNADAFNVSWQVIISGTPAATASGTWSVDSLNSGATITRTASFTPTQPGPYDITVVADPTAVLPDANRANNTRLLTVQFKDFTLAAAEPHSRTIYAGEPATYTLNTTGLNGFASPVTLSVAGLPAGVTPTWEPNQAAPPAAPVLALTTTGATLPGNYDLTVSGSDGVLTHTAGITLVVNALPDLSVTALTFDPDPAVTGQPFTLSAQVTNLGPGPAVPFAVTWQITPLGQADPIISGSWDVGSLSAGASNTLTVTNPLAPAPGPYSVTLVADSGLVLPDPDRTNNTRQAELGVTGTLNACGAITTDTTWAYATYVLTCDVSVNQNVTLTVRDGAVVKFNSVLRLNVDGTLDVHGTAPKPAVFTSYKDDNYGGDSDGSASSGTPGDWAAIEINATGSAHFDHALIRYSGEYEYYRSNSLRNAGGALTLANTTVENGMGHGIAVTSGSTLTVTDSIIRNHTANGIDLTQSGGSSSPIIRNTSFTNNTGYAIYFTLNPAAFDGSQIQSNTASGNGTNGIGLAASFTGSSTLSGDAGMPYVITSNNVIGAGNVLTIHAGAVVKLFGDWGYLVVNGTLNVLGDDVHPVTFTSLRDDTIGGETNNDAVAPAAGDWVAIDIGDPAGMVSLDHAVIRYGGKYEYYRSNSLRNGGGALTLTNTTVENGMGHGIAVTSGSTLTVTDSIIRNHTANGIDLTQSGGSTSPIIRNTAFTNNTGYAIYFTLNPAAFDGSQIQSNTASGNGTNGIGLAASFTGSSTLSGDAGMPYVITSNNVIGAGNVLTIHAGAVVKLFGDWGYLVVNGTLNVLGDDVHPVTFTSLRDDTIGGETNNDAVAPAAGDWVAIDIGDPAGMVSLDHAVIRYGGKYEYYRVNSLRNGGGALTLSNATVEYGAGNGIAVTSGSTLTVTDSLIRDQTGNGIDLTQTGGSIAPVIRNTTFTNNAGYAIYFTLNPDPVAFDGTQIQGNNASGNGTNGLGLAASYTGSSALSGDAGMPYVITSNNVIGVGNALTIHAGAVVKLLGDWGYLAVNGSLNVMGEDVHPVTFTSLRDDTVGGETNNDAVAPAPGDWVAIDIGDTSATVSLDHAVIRYGGRNDYTRMNSLRNGGGALTLSNATVEYGAGNGIAVTSGSTLTVTDSLIRDQTGNGIDLTQTGGSIVPVIRNTTFTNNAGYAIYFTLNAVTFDGTQIQSNTASGNGTNGLGLAASYTGSSTLSGDAGMPYVITSNNVIGVGNALTIHAGAVVKLLGDWGYLLVNGSLNVLGEDVHPVTFTSLRDDTVGGETNNDAVAPAPGDWVAIDIGDTSATVSLDHAVIRYGGRNDYTRMNSLRNGGGSLTLIDSTVEYGAGLGIAQYGGTLSVTNSSITHSDYGIFLIDSTTAPTLDHVVFSANIYGLFVASGPAPSLSQCSFVGNTTYGLNNPTGNLVNAANSWWGSATGPYHATLNPSGTGDVVSDNVTISPWLPAQP